MKLIINTSLEPEFCALFDNKDTLIDTIIFTKRQQTGALIWNFLKKYNFNITPITFIGGISGPGSFSSLRTTAGILNVLSFRFNLPIYQVRADVIVKSIIKKNKIPVDTFVLNSFGNSVFYPENGKLIRSDLDFVIKKLQDKIVFTQFIPDAKKSIFNKKIDLIISNIPQICLEVLKKQKSQKVFEADYEFPAV